MAPRSKSSSERSKKTTISTYTLLFLAAAADGLSAVRDTDYLHRAPVPSPNLVSRATSATIPLKITNQCPETIWPGIASQQGTGPATNGFELQPGSSQFLKVGADWQGRVWGRTNCSFNDAGTGPSNKAGLNGGGKACETGDCAGVLNCVLTGDTPVTLAEFLLAGGSGGDQTYYDISLVDGYNLPIGLTYIPGNSSTSQEIPPNLTNCACIGTAGYLTSSPSGSTNSTYPLPYDTKTTNQQLSNWCPWPNQVNPPTKPGDGVYPYPDDNIKRPDFSPCLSTCALTNKPSDCCTGSYNSPSKCSGGLYSANAKAVCPDAYSFAYDDQTSTFIIPSGGGWEVTFCPSGRSTNILKTFGKQMVELSQTGHVSQQVMADTQNVTLIQQGAGERERSLSLGALVVMLAWACFW